AAAINNALLYRERERVSMALQERLLPKALPRIPGLEAAARYLPAHEWALAGGDFYDIFEMEAGHWKAVIGDVCGTGPAAAALMGFVRFTARAVSRGDVTPSQALTKLNAALLEEIGPGSVDFCTCAIVRIVPHGGGARLVVAVGGHPLPLLVHPDGDVEEIGTPGTLLGVLEDVDVADTFAELAPGDTAILLTDGVLEASRDEHAEAAIHELLAPIAGLHPESVADIVEATVIGTEDRRPDDVAVIVLQAPLDAPPEGYRAREGLPGLLLFDAKGRWVDANLRVLADLGARRDQVVGARLDDLVVEPQDVATELEAYLAEGTWSGEVTLRRPDGTTVRYRNESRLLSAARRGPVHLSRLMPLG
ncbi:MAG TPA: SpoIIE family protein phosphatase, partial [Actinomycetota bacterium]